MAESKRKRPFYRKIFGFRSGKAWKAVIASFGYIVVLVIVIGVISNLDEAREESAQNNSTPAVINNNANSQTNNQEQSNAKPPEKPARGAIDNTEETAKEVLDDIEGATEELSEETAKLVSNFCYAFQAALVCDSLNMRRDTEGKVEKQYNLKIRNQPFTSPIGKICMSAYNEVTLADDLNSVCNDVWNRFGCSGTEIPKLVQESPFKKPNGVFCEY